MTVGFTMTVAPCYGNNFGYLAGYSHESVTTVFSASQTYTHYVCATALELFSGFFKDSFT